MKKLLVIIVGLLFSVVLLQAQNETMYIMQSGNIIGQHQIVDIDSISFNEPVFVAGQPFTDLRDFNVYQTVQIGDQVWMAENLKYLPEVTPSYNSDVNPYYYVYDYVGDDVAAAKATANYNTYGALYNWAAAMDGGTSYDNGNPSGIQGICPNGWHLPSSAEWQELKDFAGATSNLMEAGDEHWNYDVADNSTGFTALPGGMRNPVSGSFVDAGSNGNWWTTSQAQDGEGAMVNIDYQSNIYIGLLREKEYGYSVRCVKN
ncbi:MAG: FISUMP domain-containing protein [Bacteroidales bacterium]|nr:FISUMP domain-containing protein [Bacteroidales bacterium]